MTEGRGGRTKEGRRRKRKEGRKVGNVRGIVGVVSRRFVLVFGRRRSDFAVVDGIRVHFLGLVKIPLAKVFVAPVLDVLPREVGKLGQLLFFGLHLFSVQNPTSRLCLEKTKRIVAEGSATTRGERCDGGGVDGGGCLLVAAMMMKAAMVGEVDTHTHTHTTHNTQQTTP
jgi:hypothetical protein